MNELFQICVDILKYLANKTNTTYEEINVIIFVIAGPILFLTSALLNIILYRRNKHGKR